MQPDSPDMNRAALLLAILSLVGISCERHSWEETKGLHHHGKAAPHGDAAKPADAHDSGTAKPAGDHPAH